MRKIKEIIDEIELLGKTNVAYFDLREELGQRPNPYKIFCGVQKFLDCCNDETHRKLKIARELIEIGINNSKSSIDLSYLAYLIADSSRDINDVELARKVIMLGMDKFNKESDLMEFARVIEDSAAINDKK